MIDEITMPMIAIAGGFVLLFALVCILWRSRRRYVDRSSPESRRTSFHLAVIDPAIAEYGRAAWERSPLEADSRVHEVADDHLIEVIDIPLPAPAPPPVDDYTSIGHAPMPPNRPYDQRVQRFARGSTPAISHPMPHHVPPPQQMTPQPRGWDVPAAPSVTARMRAARRG